MILFPLDADGQYAFMFLRGMLLILGSAILLSGCAKPGARKSAAPDGVRTRWPDALEQKLSAAGTNRVQLTLALQQVPDSQRDGLQFLIENMPKEDARTLSADYLLGNVREACEVFSSAPWREQVSKEIFLNDVLPYACVNETREDWRKRLHEMCAPLVADCKTPGEAAQRLNQRIFPLLKVRYATDRKRADQCPSETIASGKATCTGLSILLVDACRSVGVPARLAGTLMWSNLRGNHTWVEIWDGGWHFTGAAEPDKNGSDRGWFAHDASQAKSDVPQHAIYATSFKQTGLAFPLVWARGNTSVAAVNVTDRYTPKLLPATNDKVRLLVKVLEAPVGRRVAARTTLVELSNTNRTVEGTSKGETANLNDLLAFVAAPGAKYRVSAEFETQQTSREITVGTNTQELITLTLSEKPSLAMPAQACYAPRPVTNPLKNAQAESLKKALAEFFTAKTEEQTNWHFAQPLETLLRENEPAVRAAAWEAYCTAPIHDAMKQDFGSNQAHFEKYVSPYTIKTVGMRPTNGWALFIAMHGGGGAPKQVNDNQWEIMKRYYRDHPEQGGYIYLALRAPNDTWNGFYDVYVYPLVANLVRQFLLFGDVDPNKVFLMGYSHGGYGAFAIGPKMPDRFAAIHASAAAPTDGETTAKTLRNTIFTCIVGDKDTMYGRIERDRKFAAEIEKLRGDRADIYPVKVEVKEGFGHPGLPDRDKIKEMYPAVRNPVPRELTWLMTDKVITDFFWLRVPAPAKKQEIFASCRDNRIVVLASSNVVAATVFFDSRLIDFNKPVQVELNSLATLHTFTPNLRTLAGTLAHRGDPELAFTGSFEIRKDETTGHLAVIHSSHSQR